MFMYTQVNFPVKAIMIVMEGGSGQTSFCSSGESDHMQIAWFGTRSLKYIPIKFNAG